MLSYIRTITHDAKERGASAVEYGLMVAAIAAVIVGIVFGLGSLVQGTFSKTCNDIATGTSVTAPEGCGDGGGVGDPATGDGN